MHSHCFPGMNQKSMCNEMNTRRGRGIPLIRVSLAELPRTREVAKEMEVMHSIDEALTRSKTTKAVTSLSISALHKQCQPA